MVINCLFHKCVEIMRGILNIEKPYPLYFVIFETSYLAIRLATYIMEMSL